MTHIKVFDGKEWIDLKGEPGKSGRTPVKGVDYFDGADPSEEKLVALIKPLIPKPIPGKNGTNADLTGQEIVKRHKALPKADRISYDDLKDLPNLDTYSRQASKSIEVFDESTKIEGNLESLNFSGTGVTTTSDGRGNITVVITGGAVPTLYTETPSGVIDGVNVTYTVINTISAVCSFAINGQFIHPGEYTFTGTTITMLSPIDASLSGAAFTIVYL